MNEMILENVITEKTKSQGDDRENHRQVSELDKSVQFVEEIEGERKDERSKHRHESHDPIELGEISVGILQSEIGFGYKNDGIHDLQL